MTGFDMLMKTLLLICAVGTPQADCSVETAAAVIQGPEAASLVECGLHGQAYIAEGPLAGYLEDGHYLKVACSSRQIHPRAPARDFARMSPPRRN
jgi:hypothetical protein